MGNWLFKIVCCPLGQLYPAGGQFAAIILRLEHGQKRVGVVPLLAIVREIRDLPVILLIPQAQAADGL